MKTTHQMLESHEFKSLVGKKWAFSIILTVLLFVIYYGYILLIAYAKSTLTAKVGEVTTLGIIVGVLVIILAWILTAVYVGWANGSYDNEVARLKDQVGKE